MASQPHTCWRVTSFMLRSIFIEVRGVASVVDCKQGVASVVDCKQGVASVVDCKYFLHTLDKTIQIAVFVQFGASKIEFVKIK